MVRLAHFSDIHVSAAPLGWRFSDYFSKRLTSWMNHRVFGRARKFRRSDEVVQRLVEDLLTRKIDHVVFSGDATALGFDAEVRRAADLLRVGQLPIPGLAVPGNHDYCTRKAAASGAFERYFAPWQTGRRVDAATYPFAQQVGAVWLIGVNAATGNCWPWDASGAIGKAQLERLRRLLADVGAGLKILVLHYPVCLADGRREPSHHGLRDLDALLEVAGAGGVSLWLHGHRHAPYYLNKPVGASFPVICAGTATQCGLWSYGEYEIEDNRLRGARRGFDPVAAAFRSVEEFTISLS